MPPEKIPHALKVLDVDGDGKISLTDMRDAVIQVLTQHWHLNGHHYAPFCFSFFAYAFLSIYLQESASISI